MQRRMKIPLLAREGAVQIKKANLTRPQIRHAGGPVEMRIGEFIDGDALDPQDV